ncbi:MAG: GAF domain-containing protein, partial [Cyanobacteria bacterium J06639_1]
MQADSSRSLPRSPIARISSRIRRSLELQEILDAAVAEVRDFLGTDRVKIYRFDADGHGQVIAESIAGDRLPSLKGLYFPAGDIPPQARELFQKARVRSIVDLAQQQILLSQPDRVLSTATEDLTVEEVRRQSLADLLQRPVDPCHVEYLSLMGVKSTVVVPLVVGKTLWGLLISHHRQAKAVDDYRLGALQAIADQLEIAIAQSQLLGRTRARAEREAAINHIATLLHSPLDAQNMLQSVLEQVVEATRGAGGRLLVRSLVDETSTYRCGVQPHVGDPDWQE